MALAASPGAVAQSDRDWPPEHDAALARAKVWLRPETPVEKARLGDNPGHRFDSDGAVSCRFEPVRITGNTPKFDCRLSDGTVVRVKYGAGNPEVFTEVIATRLLTALGFPADRMFVVAAVRCAGCPAEPFEALQCLGRSGMDAKSCFGDVDDSQGITFRDAVIEEPVKGHRIETDKRRGWAWDELAKIDESQGGASRAEVDAFRLLAVFLGHWDNKAENQRLLCLDGSKRCEQPLAMIQDLGATFGPDKINVARCKATPVWANAATCAVSMHSLPYGGSSFPDIRISEAGRQFLAKLLGPLTSEQIRALFAGARVDRYQGGDAASRDAQQWVDAFVQKRKAIVDRSPCPQ